MFHETNRLGDAQSRNLRFMKTRSQNERCDQANSVKTCQILAMGSLRTKRASAEE
ncbi:hypothetical protein RMSM_03637 [Rhodopirellula maiorica SM1]|uniref:Uncharacterized protein n=1 Tax=Rhodopirellula maiorica SM1 TaxID=1265738 RepID=M5RJD7_9BACT|nr:hypothetical protein RMSM_03637 [Rhodopirellula maiorica SM1]